MNFLCLNTSEISINKHIFSHQLPTSCHLDEHITINMLCSGIMIFVKQVYIWKFKKLLFIHLFIQLISLAPSLHSGLLPPCRSRLLPPLRVLLALLSQSSSQHHHSGLRTLKNFLPLGFSGSPHLCSSHASRLGLLSLSSLKAPHTLVTQDNWNSPSSELLSPSSLWAPHNALRGPFTLHPSHSGFLSPSSLRPPHKLLAQGSLQECEGF